MTLEADLRNHILKVCLPGEDRSEFDDDDELIDSGILDSLAIMGLVEHLETTYAIRIETGEIAPENFGSVRMLANFVRAKLGGA